MEKQAKLRHGNKKPMSSSTLGYLLIFIAGAIWGTGGTLVTYMTRMGASPAMTSFTAHFIAVIGLGLLILFTKGPKGFKITKRGLIFTIIMGIVTKAVFKLAYDSSVATVGASTGVVLLYTAPIFVAIMSVIFLKEKLRLNNYIALGLNLLGVVLMVTLGNFTSLNINPVGVFLGILAGFLHGLNTILAKFAGNDDDPLTKAFYMMLSSSAVLIFVAQPWSAANVALLTSGEFIFWALISGIVTGALGNFVYLKGLSMDVDASKAPVISSVEVIVATFMGVLILSEPMNWVGIVGMLIMIFSIYLMNKKPTAVETAEEVI